MFLLKLYQYLHTFETIKSVMFFLINTVRRFVRYGATLLYPRIHIYVH